MTFMSDVFMGGYILTWFIACLSFAIADSFNHGLFTELPVPWLDVGGDPTKIDVLGVMLAAFHSIIVSYEAIDSFQNRHILQEWISRGGPLYALFSVAI